MFKDDNTRIHHILEAANEAVTFTQGCTRESLDTDRKLNLSLTRLLEIIGEAATGVSMEFRQSHPQIPWTKMTGMRNRLIHGYFDINMDVVWKTVIQDLPPLIEMLNQLVETD